MGRPICWLGFVPPALLASSFIFPDLLSPVPSARGGDFFRALQLQESNRIEIEFKAKARTGWLGFCGVPKSDGVQNRILAISRRDPPGKEGGIVVCFSCHVAAGVAAAHPPCGVTGGGIDGETDPSVSPPLSQHSPASHLQPVPVSSLHEKNHLFLSDSF